MYEGIASEAVFFQHCGESADVDFDPFSSNSPVKEGTTSGDLGHEVGSIDEVPSKAAQEKDVDRQQSVEDKGIKDRLDQRERE